VESKYLRTVTADEFPRRKDAGFRKLACHIAHDWFNARTGMCVLVQAALYRLDCCVILDRSVKNS
jgi:hypothetical protein